MTIEICAVRVALFAFVASWLAWFSLFSVGWERYLMPAVFVGGMFVAATLADVEALPSLAMLENRTSKKSGNLRAVVASAISLSLVPFVVRSLLLAEPAGASTARVARYIDTTTPATALIETYETS